MRVHLKDLQLFIYLPDGSWKLIHNVSEPHGALYVEDFKDDKNKPAQIEKEEGGGISIQAGSGYNFHFFGAQELVNGDDIRGVFVVCKARLIGAKLGKPMPKYLLSVGADYWRDKGVTWAPGFANNADVGIGRFKYITPQWKYFTMHTFSQEEVKNITFPKI